MNAGLQPCPLMEDVFDTGEERGEKGERERKRERDGGSGGKEEEVRREQKMSPC